MVVVGLGRARSLFPPSDFGLRSGELAVDVRPPVMRSLPPASIRSPPQPAKRGRPRRESGWVGLFT